MNYISAKDVEECKTKVLDGSALPIGVRILGTSVIFDSTLSVRMYLSINSSIYEKVSITVDGEVWEILPYEDENVYYIDITGISVQDVFNMFEISITDGERTYAVKYGVGSYAYTVLSKGTGGVSAQNMIKALLLYAYLADSYEDTLSGESV